MDKKFELTNEGIYCCGKKLYRIKALKNFFGITIGELGGFVEKESNLSQEGNCWIYDNARVYDNAKVCGNAGVYNNAKVCDNAKVYDNATIGDNVEVRDNTEVYGNAIIGNNVEVRNNAKAYDNAKIYGNARISDKAEVYGHARVYDDAVICGNAGVSGNADVYNKAIIYGNAKVSDCAEVCGEADVSDYAEVNREMKISNGYFIKNTIEESVRCQTGLASYNGEVIAYKRVNKDLTSLFDRNFKYIVGEWVEAENPDMSDKSCASGLHFSNATYWDRQIDSYNTVLLIAKIRLEDIITVQQGKIRCKRAFIMGVCDT